MNHKNKNLWHKIKCGYEVRLKLILSRYRLHAQKSFKKVSQCNPNKSYNRYRKIIWRGRKWAYAGYLNIHSSLNQVVQNKTVAAEMNEFRLIKSPRITFLIADYSFFPPIWLMRLTRIECVRIFCSLIAHLDVMRLLKCNICRMS